MLFLLQVAITFVANEGVLLSSPSGKVLIDALISPYRTYAHPSDSLRRAMEAGRPPFDSVSAVLVTHRHGDHFGAGPVNAFLRNNPRARLITSQQVIDSLHRLPGAPAVPSTQLWPATMSPGARRRLTVNGITIEVLGLSHGSGRHETIQHVGFLVEMDGVRILHIGDTDVQPGTFAPFRLDTTRIDVALLPGWSVADPANWAEIARWVRPRTVMAFHFGPGDDDPTARRVRAAIPEAIVLSRPMERREVSPAR